MGRPLKKDINGINVIGTPAGTNAGIIVSANVNGIVNNDYYLVKQRGARTYVITRDGAIKSTCKTSIDTSAPGSMVIIGLNGATQVPIRKLTKKIAIDFSGQKYKWELSNYGDSTSDSIILTQL